MKQNYINLLTLLFIIDCSTFGQEILLNKIYLNKESLKILLSFLNLNGIFAVYDQIGLSEEFWNLAKVYRMSSNNKKPRGFNDEQILNSHQFVIFVWIKYSVLSQYTDSLFDIYSTSFHIDGQGQFDVFTIDYEENERNIFLRNNEYASLKNQWVFINQGVDLQKKIFYIRVQTASGDFTDSVQIPFKTNVGYKKVVGYVFGLRHYSQIEGRNLNMIQGDGANMEDKFERTIREISK